MSDVGGHYIEKCSCGVVLSQCRCLGPKVEIVRQHPACGCTCPAGSYARGDVHEQGCPVR